jgi:hypothetical protein
MIAFVRMTMHAKLAGLRPWAGRWWTKDESNARLWGEGCGAKHYLLQAHTTMNPPPWLPSTLSVACLQALFHDTQARMGTCQACARLQCMQNEDPHILCNTRTTRAMLQSRYHPLLPGHGQNLVGHQKPVDGL